VLKLLLLTVPGFVETLEFLLQLRPQKDLRTNLLCCWISSSRKRVRKNSFVEAFSGKLHWRVSRKRHRRCRQGRWLCSGGSGISGSQPRA